MPRTLSSTLVFGAEITNGEGKKIGQVEDLLIDVKSGHVIYALVSFKSEVEKDDHYYPIPIKAINKSSERNELAVSIETLKNAPAFEKDNWHGEYDEEQIRQVYSYYGLAVPLLSNE